LYLHGFASGPSSAKARLLAPPLQARGYHVAVPDQNEGDFSHLTITRALALARRHLRERTLIIGSSLGGYIAALLAQKDERVKGMVLMAPAFAIAERFAVRYGKDKVEQWREKGSIDVEHYAMESMQEIGYAFFEDASKQESRPPIRVPTYVLQGTRDDLVPAAMVEEIARRHPGVVDLDLVDDDHALGRSADRALAATWRLIERLGLGIEPEEIDPADALEALRRREEARESEG
jgi:pimeloyl-ACP methyl ester carboxylesterase